jgi:hypothetical protein
MERALHHLGLLLTLYILEAFQRIRPLTRRLNLADLYGSKTSPLSLIWHRRRS